VNFGLLVWLVVMGLLLCYSGKLSPLPSSLPEGLAGFGLASRLSLGEFIPAFFIGDFVSLLEVLQLIIGDSGITGDSSLIPGYWQVPIETIWN
jgi:hypothetical protein